MAVNDDLVKQFERLVRMIEAKTVRQRSALADSELQLSGAKTALDNAKKGK